MSANRTAARSGAWLVAAVAVALAWRGAALVWPSSLVTIPDHLRLPMAALGVWFLICTGAVRWRRPHPLTDLLLLYGIASAIHWGGSVGAGQGDLPLAAFFFYLAASLVAEAAFLHLAWVFPLRRPLGGAARSLLYAPAGVTLLLAPVAGLMPLRAVQAYVVAWQTLANLFTLAAAILFLIALARATPATRRAARLPLLVGGMAASALVASLGTTGMGLPQSEAWNLSYALFPVLLALAVWSWLARNGERR